MTPNPNDLDLQRAHSAATARSTSMVMASNGFNDHTAVTVSSGTRHETASDGRTLHYGDLNRVGDPPSSGSKKPTIGSYNPPMNETFTTFISVLLVAGIVACACVFPYLGTLDAQADDYRWEITLARWTLAEGLPTYDLVAQFARAPAAEGLEAYLSGGEKLDFDVVAEGVAGAPDEAPAPEPAADDDQADAPAPAETLAEAEVEEPTAAPADRPAASPSAEPATEPTPEYRPIDTVDKGALT